MTYLDTNFTICLLIVGETAITPWTVFSCCRKTIKHCLPIITKFILTKVSIESQKYNWVLFTFATTSMNSSSNPHFFINKRIIQLFYVHKLIFLFIGFFALDHTQNSVFSNWVIFSWSSILSSVALKMNDLI